MSDSTLNQSLANRTWGAVPAPWGIQGGSWTAQKFTKFTLAAEESIVAGDDSNKTLERGFSESIGLSDAEADAVTKDLSDLVGVTDSVQKRLTKGLSESISVSEVVVKSQLRGFFESISITEEETDPGSYIRGFSESVGVSDSIQKLLTKGLGESVSIHEAVGKTNLKRISEHIGITEEETDPTDYKRQYFETINVVDAVQKFLIKSLSESISAHDAVIKDLSRGFLESIEITEDETDPSDYNRNYYESISVSDSVQKTLTKAIDENIKAFDAFIKPYAMGVLSDISIEDISMLSQDFNELEQNETPAGFQPWQPYIDGEYEYQRAFIRLNVEDRSQGAVFDTKVMEEAIVCDVDDVIDNGTALITDIQRVEFNKIFARPPVVIATVNNVDDFAIPTVISTDETSFTIRLRKIDDTNATGTINWQAKGY